MQQNPFINIKNTDKRLEKNEKEKNKKTLVMIDLMTQKERDNLNRFAYILENKKNISKNEEYEVGSPWRSSIKSRNQQAPILYMRAGFCCDKKIDKILKKILNNNHVNLDLHSLEKINNTISNLNNAIKDSEHFREINGIYEIISADNELPVKKQKNIECEYKRFSKFIELLNQISKDLSD
ncbi:hypothetical protein [Staphylococcus equorum]|uniref:hypothetical protein n=1 Tax=Staphylococcus equorum TaxID=246432 RepID=UPI0035939204